MDEIIKLLMNMGKTKEEALEFVGKEMPTGGIDDVGSNIIKPITKKVAGDYPLIGSRITDPTQQGQFGKYFIQTLDPKDRYNLIRQSIDDQKENWQKTFEFIRTGGYKLSALQKQNLNHNLGVLQRSKIVLTDITKGLESQKIDVEELYSSFVKNKRFLGNESTGLSSEGNDILEYINKTKEKIEDLTKTGKKQEEILSQQKKDNDARMKRLYNGRAYEKNDGNYRALGGYHLPKLHEAGIINLDPKIYEAIKKGQYHHGGADFFAPDPNRVLQYHYGTKIFDDLDDAINKAAMDGEVALKGPDGMIKFLKDNDYLPFKKDGPTNALDYMNDVEKLERIKELDSATKTIKSGDSPFYKTPDSIMGRVMENANDKFQYLDSLKRTHPGKFKLYQKDISEEPFFGVDIGQNDLFSDLSDLTFPKDKGDLLPFPKKEGIKAVDDDKRLLTDDEIMDYEAELGDTEYWMMDGTLGEAKEALKISKAEEAEAFDLYKTGKLDPEAGSVTRARLKFLKNKLEEAELSGDNRLISEDEIFELEGLEKRFRKEDLEFKVNEQPERKLSDEEIKELKDLTDDDPDFNMAEGGRVDLKRGGGKFPTAINERQQTFFDKTNEAFRVGNLTSAMGYGPENYQDLQNFVSMPVQDQNQNLSSFRMLRSPDPFNSNKGPFDKQGFSSDIRHGLGISAGKDAIIDYISSKTPIPANSRLAGDLGIFGANIASLFEEGKDIFSSAKSYAENYPGLTGIQDYDYVPDNKYLTQPFEDISANYAGSKIPYGMSTPQKIAFLSNYKKYGNQTLNQIKNLELKKVQDKIKVAEQKEKIRIETLRRQRASQEQQRQADQARINRAYRQETGGQGGSYATGRSGVQSDGSYNDPFDPGGGE